MSLSILKYNMEAFFMQKYRYFKKIWKKNQIKAGKKWAFLY